MASPTGHDGPPPASVSLPSAPADAPEAPPPPPAPVHQPRPPAAAHTAHAACPACAASVASVAVCGPPPSYDEAMGLSPTRGAIDDWPQPFINRPPAYYSTPNIHGSGIPAADLREIFDFFQSSSRTSNSESLTSEARAKPSLEAVNATNPGAPLCLEISDTDWNLVLGQEPPGDASAAAREVSPPVTVQPRHARRPPARSTARLASRGGARGNEAAAADDDDDDDERTWAPYAVRVLCPRCQRVVCTDIVVEDAEYTHVCALGLCLMGCWPFCLVPYCLDACRRVTHSCPRCHMLLGAYSPRSPQSPHQTRATRARSRARARSTACR